MASESQPRSLASVDPSRPTGVDAEVEAFLVGARDERTAAWMAFSRIPSVSAQPERAADCRAAAAWLVDDMRRAGIEHVAIEETAGLPMVTGDWLHANGRPTVIVYGHYDVQPPDPLDLWETAPFEPLLKDDRLIGRGVEDNKSCVVMHVRAFEALLRTRGHLPVNLKFLFEGEEESGSPNLDPWLESARARLGADVAVISDTDFFEGNQPAICIGVRGLLAFEIEILGPDRDLHSGAYGGAVQNPLQALAEILTGLKGPDGRILVDGFYDDVRDIGEAERAAIAALPFNEPGYRDDLQVPELFGEPGYTTVERKTARPTLDVNGIWGGYSGDGPKMIIPAEAHAKVSCRLVPDQDPARIFELIRDHIERIKPRGVRVTTSVVATGHPALTPIDHPATKAAARAIEATFGVPSLYYRAGGAVPITASFANLLGLPVVLLGFAPPDSRSHSPNEWMSLRNFETGIRTIARYWDELAVSLGAGPTGS
jgi:acetylornithine deacetylase/succinyl-diaminopimelate desuccinylase-like protein